MKKEEIRKKKLLGKLERNASLRSDVEKAEKTRAKVASLPQAVDGTNQRGMDDVAWAIDAGLTKSYKVSDWKRR